METPVTDREFLEALHELDHKINFVKEQSFKEAKSCNDVADILEKLKIKVSGINGLAILQFLLYPKYFNWFIVIGWLVALLFSLIRYHSSFLLTYAAFSVYYYISDSIVIMHYCVLIQCSICITYILL